MNRPTLDADARQLKSYLDPIAARFETASFIKDDPISIPHAFDDPRDQEIMALFAALLAWGRRDIMLRKLEELCERMAFKPASFIHGYKAMDRSRIEGFVHRTFNDADLEGLILALQSTLAGGSIETFFKSGVDASDPVKSGLEAFSSSLLDAVPGRPRRMNRHVARPSSGSACKRLNMYLRWMVRSGPVDLGLWTCVDPSHLMLPLDVHSGTQARHINLLSRKANDWRSVEELTLACRSMDPIDPCRYDFAFFGTGSAGETLCRPD